MKKRSSQDVYTVHGKDADTVLHVGPDRKAFWLLPGALITKREAKELKKYRRKTHDLRRSALRKGYLVDVSERNYLVAETMVFDSVSAATSFILGGSRSGDVAKSGRRKLVGRNLDPRDFNLPFKHQVEFTI